MTYLVARDGNGDLTLWRVNRHDTTAIPRETDLPHAARYLFPVFADAAIRSHT